MGTMYYPAGNDVALLVNNRISTHHDDMHKVGVRVGVLMATNDSGPAVKLHGAACNATIRVVAHRDRVTKGYDAEMVIDARNWEDFSHRQRLALVAHELKHLILVKKVDRETKAQRVQFDDGGRPKLKCRPGDWDAGDGFAEIVAEFGEDAIEYTNMRSAWRLADQAKELGVVAKAESSLLGNIEEGEDDGHEPPAGPRSGDSEAAAGGTDEDDDFGFGPDEHTGPTDPTKSLAYDEREEGPSYDERTWGI